MTLNRNKKFQVLETNKDIAYFEFTYVSHIGKKLTYAHVDRPSSSVNHFIPLISDEYRKSFKLSDLCKLYKIPYEGIISIYDIKIIL